MGQLYQRGRIWWVKYYVNGRPVRESTGVMKEQEARRFLKAREGDTAKGLPMLPRADRLRYEDAVADLKQHYATTGDRDLEEAGWRLAHLEPCFRGRRLASIGRAEVTAYANRRQSEGASNATINRELGVLGRMLKLAYENSKLVRLPIIRKLKEGAPREGFFEDHQYQAVRWRPPEDLQVAIDIMHTFGWRKVLGLERRQLDLKAGTLRLDPGSTKNDEGRVVYLTPELKSALTAHVARVDAQQRRLGRIVPVLFPHIGKGKRAGTPRGDFRKAWATACKAAGVAGRLRHDFRRTAVRNMERKAVPGSVAMKITGHLTEAVYRRYAIVSDADLQEATRRIAGTFSGTPERSAVDGGPVSV
jgi:integrase